MRILITGGAGQLGRDLQASLVDHEVRACSHSELDITDAAAVTSMIETFRPMVVLHTAALTDTARCEREPAAAHAANALGARNVAVACANVGAAMAYVSTNEVFDGEQAGPYLESDEPNPINAYGRSKLEGERLVQEALPQHYIVRTAWLYGHAGDTFVAKILRAAEGGKLTGVKDELATPTWTRDLAHALTHLVETDVYGVYHLTNTGQASRYEWIEEILRLAGTSDVELRAVTTAEYRALRAEPLGLSLGTKPQDEALRAEPLGLSLGTKPQDEALRAEPQDEASLSADAVVPQKPRSSVLRNVAAARLGIELRPWQEALAAYFAAG